MSADAPLCRVIAGIVLVIACVFCWAPRAIAADNPPDTALAQLLATARAESTGANCTSPDADQLTQILCDNRLRVGVRADYPLFGGNLRGVREGYEIDVARAVGEKLGLPVEFVPVKAANRIAMLADDSIDVVIGTMGDNTQRETQVRFVRPHYYRSETVLVGPKDRRIDDWEDIRGSTVCVTIGNGSNAELVSHGVRLMLFDTAANLPERLADQTCSLAAQDDSFFAYYFTAPDFADRFSVKFGFGALPWGMGVAREGSDRLARVLDLTSEIFHRDGVFLAAARANRIGTAFLIQQHETWTRPECNTDLGSTNPACVLKGGNAELEPTPFAAPVLAFETWFNELTGSNLVLAMLETAPAWSLFLNGLLNSLLLIAGALASTLAFACLFGWAMGSRFPLLRWPAYAVTITLQSSPILLTLVIVAAVMHALFPYSPAMALIAAIVALGLANGSNAGQAISEAYRTLRAEWSGTHTESALFARALSRSATQIVAFLINAAKGTPIASFIGAPELLSALTDITSFSSGRVTTYTLLLVFYTAIVMVVVWLCHRLQHFLERGRLVA